MKVFILSFFCLLVSFGFSQTTYPLHPSVGDTIELNEKLDYSLFDSIANENFLFAWIEFQKDNFYLISTWKSDLVVPLSEATFTTKYLLSQEQIIEEQKKIEKVNTYYRYLAEEAKKPKKAPEKSISKAPPIRLQGPMSEHMKKEVRMNNRLKDEQRRSREFKLGLRPRNMFIQFD